MTSATTKNPMKRPIPGGLLVAVEGIDGAGKTSLSAHLAQWCGERGLGCVLSKEPTGLKWGTEMRESGKKGRLTVEEELRYFELDRRDHIERSIAPALREGNIVILDRYYWSTAAYQGARGADVDQIIRLHEKFAPTPDVVFVLDLDVDAGLCRIRARGDHPNLFENKAALLKAKQIFLRLAEVNKNGIIVDSSGHFRDTCTHVLTKFQQIGIEKISAAAELHEQAVNLITAFLGGDFVDSPATPVPDALKSAFRSVIPRGE